MNLFDSHCHLTDRRFHGEVEEVLARARDAGVTRVTTIASDARDAEAALELARSHEGIHCTAGVHPHAAAEAVEGDLERIESLLRTEDLVVAVGETGLDFHYDNSPREVQRRLFRWHLELGAELSLPVVVHSRSADEDTEALLRDLGGAVTGVLHCYTGGPSLMDTALELGWYVSFTGIASFGSFGGEAQVRDVPRERLMVETDAPYLAPVPRRGKRNEPAFVRYVAEALARIRDEEVGDLAAYTARNALRFYGLED